MLMIEVASEQGRAEKDAALRGRHFGKAIGSVKKMRSYWKNKPQWEQDSLDLASAGVKIDQMDAEEAMGLGNEAVESGKSAASTLLAFLQSHCPTESHSLDKMEPGEVRNLERCYEMMIPVYSRIGAEFAGDVLKFGGQYMELFPNGRERTLIQNCMNKAKAEGATGAAPGRSAAAEPSAAE